MKCQQAKQCIVNFLDDELRKPDEQDLYKHLSSCSSCSKYLDQARQTDNLLKKLLVLVEPPEDFAQQVMLGIKDSIEHCAVEEHSVAEEAFPEKVQRTGKTRWISSLRVGWLKSGVAASVAVLLLVGGLGLSGSASMNDSFAKRVFLMSRDGISGIRRVVDNVISNNLEKLEEKDNKEDSLLVDKAAEEKTALKENNPKEDLALLQEPEENFEDQAEVPLIEDSEEGKEQSKVENSDQGASGASIDVGPKVSLAAIVSPVVVANGIDNVRPVWADRDSIYYLSEKKAPRDGTYVIWEANPKGTTRYLLSSPGYCMTLENGGGVWSQNKRNVAFVTNMNGFWQIGSSNLKGQPSMTVAAVKGEKVSPAEGVLWEYYPVVSSKDEVAFLTKRFGNVDIMVADKEGKLRTLTKTPESESNPVWSKDGTRLAYFRYSSAGGTVNNGRIFVSDKNGRSVKAVTPAMSKVNMVASWSPDGKQLAVNLNAHGSKNGLWVVNSDGSNWRQVSDQGGGKVVEWSPNGKMIAFTDNSGQLKASEISAGEAEPEIVPVEPNDQNGTVSFVSWSPDSKQLVFEWKGEQTKTTAIWRAELINFK